MATETLTQSRITLDFQPPVARLTLHHPPLNVIDIAMMDELAQALAEIEARDDVSTLVLSGAGKSFSVGVDVAAHTPDKVAEHAGQVSRRDSRPGQQQESDDRRRAWPLPGRRRGIGHGLRPGLHRRKTRRGDSLKSSWDAIRRWRLRLWRLWSGKSTRPI